MILQEALRQADVQKLAAATYEYHRAADSGPTVYDERRCHGVTKAHYPAIFTKEPDGIHVTFPDLPGCITWGRDVSQAIEAARTALTLHLSGMRQDKQSLPPATSVSLCKEREQVKDNEVIYIIYEA